METWYSRFGKSAFDLAGAVILIVLLAPAMILIAIVNYFDQGTILFIQTRIGKGNKPFRIYKFKTVLLKDRRQVITPFANFLRAHGLDETPQLFNVIRGDMSLVGPRPLFPDYLSFYTSEELRRHRVKPGITGTAQINGGNDLSWDEKLRMDLYYVSNASFAMDVKILFQSIARIFKNSKHWDVKPLSEERV